MNEKPEKTVFNPDKSDDWLWFVKTIQELAKDSNKSFSWHWFWGLYYLSEYIPNFDYNRIIATLPNEHWLKMEKTQYDNSKDSTKYNQWHAIRENIKAWANHLVVSKKITKINFFEQPFDKSIDFSNIIFPVETDFRGATFSRNALFSNALFFENVDFENAKFHTEINKYEATARFKNAIFKKVANFKNTLFWGYPNFKFATFSGRTSFQEAKFKTHAPRFYNAKFNNEMTWTGIELPEEITDEKNRHIVQENQNSYENTSILLGNEKKYHDQHLFFRAEMRCRRRLGNTFNAFIYELYETFADYGYGVGHAFFWWLVNISVWAYSLFFAIFHNKCSIYERIVCSIITSLSNAHSFVLPKSEILKGCSVNPKDLLTFNFIWATQTILGILFLFLLALTLRVRFRLTQSGTQTTNN